MTQASLSPDLDPNLTIGGFENGTGGRAGMGPEASLWLLALTSLTLVFASLLLLGLVAQSVVTDASLSGFATAMATVSGGLGLVVMGYVLLAARRAGYLKTSDGIPARARRPVVAHDPIATAGLRVAPVVPAGLAYHRRQQLAEERAERRRQARAIDAARLSRHTSRAATPTVVRTHTVETTARPVTPASAIPARPAPATVPNRAARPLRSVAGAADRPAAVPAFLRLDPPRVRPRGQAALLQVGVASVRTPFVLPPPHPLLPGATPRH